MKKTICLLIAALFLISAFVGCKKSGSNPSGTSGAKVSRDGYYPDIPEVNYNGATFLLMGRSEDSNWGELGLFSDGSDSTVLNDAVYDRNCRVEYDCNINIEQVRVDDALACGGAFYDILLANNRKDKVCFRVICFT